jgi:hypothetical protein
LSEKKGKIKHKIDKEGLKEINIEKHKENQRKIQNKRARNALVFAE